jgi:hypothetical protein
MYISGKVLAINFFLVITTKAIFPIKGINFSIKGTYQGICGRMQFLISRFFWSLTKVSKKNICGEKTVSSRNDVGKPGYLYIGE